jgi:hypothetical protein
MKAAVLLAHSSFSLRSIVSDVSKIIFDSQNTSNLFLIVSAGNIFLGKSFCK